MEEEDTSSSTTDDMQEKEESSETSEDQEEQLGTVAVSSDPRMSRPKIVWLEDMRQLLKGR